MRQLQSCHSGGQMLTTTALVLRSPAARRAPRTPSKPVRRKARVRGSGPVQPAGLDRWHEGCDSVPATPTRERASGDFRSPATRRSASTHHP